MVTVLEIMPGPMPHFSPDAKLAKQLAQTFASAFPQIN
jgi:hypothetical protein